MTIRIRCQKCGVKLDAPDSMLGKKGKCPKCGTIFRVADAQTAPAPVQPKTVEPTGVVTNEQPSLIHNEGFPKRFGLNNFYVILGRDRIVAYFKSGEGWLLNIGSGFTGARQENQLIPDQGDFVLVEGIVRSTEEGHRLFGTQFFKIAGRGDLSPIGRGDEEILEKLSARTTLTLSQKRHLLRFLRDRFFPDFTEKAPEVVDYLLGEDFHSEWVGDCRCENTAGLPVSDENA